MANNLWTAFVAGNGSNDILVASLPEGGTWTPSVPINQTSPFTPSLALFNGILYVAFITDDEDSATGIPSNRIFLCSTTDGVTWSGATFFNHHSKCAPSLAVWNGKLHIAFVANDSSDVIYVYFSSTPDDPASWSETVATNQTSALAPSLAAYGPPGKTAELYLAFISVLDEIRVCSLPVGGTWSTPSNTDQFGKFSPSLAVGDTLYLVFAANNAVGGQYAASNDLYLCSLNANGGWSAPVPLNQSSSATPCAAEFGAGLSVGFVANNGSGEVLLVSNSNPTATWADGNVDLKQQSAAGPALAAAPFACCWQQVQFPGTLGGNSQYVFWSGLGNDNQPIPVTGLVVEIDIDEAIVVSSTKGSPPGSPIGFQINGLPARKDQQPGHGTTGWSPTAGDLATGWQQYGVKMWPKTTRLISWSQYWPPSVFQNPNVLANFTANIPNQDTVTLPNDLTIPAGWKIRFTFNYSQQSPGTITGFDCKVTDSNGNGVGPDMGINFLNPPNTLTSGGPIELANLSQLVAFQVVLVGFYDSAQAFMTSGGGSITVQASTPLTVQTGWSTPVTVGNGGTAENSNSTYGKLPQVPEQVVYAALRRDLIRASCQSASASLPSGLDFVPRALHNSRFNPTRGRHMSRRLTSSFSWL